MPRYLLAWAWDGSDPGAGATAHMLPPRQIDESRSFIVIDRAGGQDTSNCCKYLTCWEIRPWPVLAVLSGWLRGERSHARSVSGAASSLSREIGEERDEKRHWPDRGQPAVRSGPCGALRDEGLARSSRALQGHPGRAPGHARRPGTPGHRSSNIIKEVVPERELFEAQVGMAMAHFGGDRQQAETDSGHARDGGKRMTKMKAVRDRTRCDTGSPHHRGWPLLYCCSSRPPLLPLRLTRPKRQRILTRSATEADGSAIGATREVDQSCVAVQVPPNAHLDSSRSGWKCSRGYRQVDEACAVVDVPANAFLKANGRDWECARGYSQVDQACVAIEVPENAYPVDAYGRGWQCDRGYREANGACVVVVIPSNAFLDSSGRAWRCGRGFQRTDESCVAVEVPSNGYLGASGDRFECTRGFRRKGNTCAPIEVPGQAHLATSGRDWECDRGYRRSGDSCVAVEVVEHAYLAVVWPLLGVREGVREYRYFVRRFLGTRERSHGLFGQ